MATATSSRGTWSGQRPCRAKNAQWPELELSTTKRVVLSMSFSYRFLDLGPALNGQFGTVHSLLIDQNRIASLVQVPD